MQRIQTIYNQILWDHHYSIYDFTLGYRNGDELSEMNMGAWEPEGPIPWHRVLYVSFGEEKVWDRVFKIDKLGPEHRKK